MKTGKYLVLAVVEENKLEEVPAQMLEWVPKLPQFTMLAVISPMQNIKVLF